MCGHGRDASTLEEGLKHDGSLVIDAKVLPGQAEQEQEQLHLLGTCVSSQVNYSSGTVKKSHQSRPWAAVQEFQSDTEQAAWCSPFSGLYGAMEHALAHRHMLSASLHKEGAASEEKTDEGLLAGASHGKIEG